MEKFIYGCCSVIDTIIMNLVNERLFNHMYEIYLHDEYVTASLFNSCECCDFVALGWLVQSFMCRCVKNTDVNWC